MRFVWAVAAFVLAALLIGAGIAQRTIFQGPTTSTTQISVDSDAPYLMIDGAVLNTSEGTQTLRAQAEGDIFAAYGRTVDMKAWLADTSYTSVTAAADGDVRMRVVEPAALSEDAEEAVVHSAVGSDLWLDEFQQSDVLIAPLQLPDDMSVLVATDGTASAPTDVSISWPIGNGTPWAGPLMVLGGAFLAIGAFLYILGIRHARRSRGPRRKGLPLAATEPIDLAVEGADKGVISSGTPRRALEYRRAFAIVPAVAVSALLFTGCSADAWPQFAPSPTPTPTASVVAPEGQKAPAVTKAQAERILARVASTVAEADEARDPALAASRLDGAALGVRETNYTLRGAIAEHPVLPAVLTKPLEILLPQAFEEWPRSFMAVVDDEETKTSSIMFLTQSDAWAPYKLAYVASLEASTEMPGLAPAYIGASQIPPDSSFLLLPPDQMAAAYADVLNNGEDSEFATLFDAENDQFRVGIEADRAKRLEEFNQTGAQTGTLTFNSSAGEEIPISLATIESGAIVAVNIYETDTVKPTNADAVIKVDGNETVKSLAGASQSTTGFETVFSDQLFFYVPGQGSSEKIRLLGYGSDILDAKVIP
ncbi:glycosyl transferase [Microbacterium lacus]|uniref:glycosyl transferase n=1 Tax=Microbacterium lacus TaxID=415217 RepID=UPI00384FE811